MKLLYVIIAACVYRRTTNAFDTKHTLLIPPDDIELADDLCSLDIGSSYDFDSGQPVHVDSKDTDLVGLNLTAPFIVTAIFKSKNGKPSCLFSIKQNKLKVMSLCIHPAQQNILRVTLLTELYSPSNSISYLVREDFKGKWIKIVIYVRDDTADLYWNCNKSPEKLTLLKDKNVVLTEDMKLKLAYSPSTRFKFEALIKEISLYTDADDDTLKFICDELRGEPLSNRSNSEMEENIRTVSIPGQKGDIGPMGPLGPPGMPGYKGDRGDTGPKGDRGLMGQFGAIGLPGYKGDRGDTGPKGAIGLMGHFGPIGMPGYKGDRGITGSKGDMGLIGHFGPIGMPGYKGDRGITGSKGDMGTTGLYGRPGMPGMKGEGGYSGPKGDKGSKGESGSLGFPGYKGHRGSSGPKGDKGSEGPYGIPGMQGEKGDKGDKGLLGLTGMKGKKGDQGPEGDRGSVGDKGDMGVRGLPGLVGPPGYDGHQGEKGDRGSSGYDGMPGRDGLPASLKSLLLAENADVVEKLRGFKGKTGETGFPGLQGERGQMGMKGESGYKGQIGEKGDRGSDGLDGIVGPPGIMGEPGPAGPQGIIGPEGRRGPEGWKGDKGATGYDGRPGFNGPPGFKGDHGESGLPGVPGQHGPLGQKGEPGEKYLIHGERGADGPIGPPGMRGEKGVPGENGAHGATGLKGEKGFEGVWGPPGIRGEKGQKGSPPEIDWSKGNKGDQGLTGETGMPGLVGPQGVPGICGPPGPPGLPGPPGESVFLRTTETTSTEFVPTTSPDVKHTLLTPGSTANAEIVDDSYTPGVLSYKFDCAKPAEVDPSETGLVGLNLSAPFIVTAIFKSYTSRTSCLFSITQENRTVMSLCLQPAGLNVTRVTLITDLYSPEDSISYLFNENYKDKWTKVVLYVKDDTADLYVNCIKSPETLTLLKNRDLLLTKDMQINLGFSKSRLIKFEGLIEDINLRTNVNDDTLLHVCEETKSQVKKNPKEIRAEYDLNKDLSECQNYIKVYKKRMYVKEDMIEQIDNITRLIRNEIREDIEDLRTTNEYITGEFNRLLESMQNITTEHTVTQNKVFELEKELFKLKNEKQKPEITTLESHQKISRNKRQTLKRKERNTRDFE